MEFRTEGPFYDQQESVPAGWREDFWRFWRNHLLSAEPVCNIFPCLRRLHVSDHVLRRAAEDERKSGEESSFRQQLGRCGSSLGESMEVPLSLDTGIRWNSLFGDEFKDGPLLWDFTRKEAPMMC